MPRTHKILTATIFNNNLRALSDYVRPELRVMHNTNKALKVNMNNEYRHCFEHLPGAGEP